MNIMHRNRDRSIDTKVAQSSASPLPAGYGEPSVPRPHSAPHRVSRAWIASCALASVVFIALTVFVLQNTGATEFSFLWMSGSAPIALALLIATAGGLLLAQFGSIARRRRG